MRIALFEEAPEAFFPLTWLRPVFELRCGHFTPRERLETLIPSAQIGVFLRGELVEVYREEHPHLSINDEAGLATGSTLLINGRWLGDPRTLTSLSERQMATCEGQLVALVVQPDEAPLFADGNWCEVLGQLAKLREEVAAAGRMVSRPWDIVDHNPTQIAADHDARGAFTADTLPGQLGLVGPIESLALDESAKIDPYVVIDTTHGPVWIDEDVRIQAFTRIEGPCFIGRGTQLFRANIREGCSIGPVCRVGGELEESILHGYSNKYHDGFLGHSYVCSWVNLGALTTNSDLKNDYSAVKVPLVGESIDTGETKVGAFIGDHTKTALCSLFNTGTSVGVMTQILPGGELLPKHIPSFCRIWHGELEPLPDGMTSSLATARTAMARRGLTLTTAMERLLMHVYQATEPERQRAFARVQGQTSRV